MSQLCCAAHLGIEDISRETASFPANRPKVSSLEKFVPLRDLHTGTFVPKHAHQLAESVVGCTMSKSRSALFTVGAKMNGNTCIFSLIIYMYMKTRWIWPENKKIISSDSKSGSYIILNLSCWSFMESCSGNVVDEVGVTRTCKDSINILLVYSTMTMALHGYFLVSVIS